MILSLEGLEFIKKRENFKEYAYYDSKGIPTIGFGRIENVKMGDFTTLDAELRWLVCFCDKLCKQINNLIKIPLAQHEYDAIVSLTFNIGINAFKKSTLLQLLNKEKKIAASKQFIRWNKIRINNKVIVSKGLTNRRILETELFLHSTYK